MSEWQTVTILFLFSVYLGGFLSAFHAIRYAKTSQSAIAWVLSLILFPVFALIVYWFFGPHKFDLYQQALSDARNEHRDSLEHYLKAVTQHQSSLDSEYAPSELLLSKIFPWPITEGNHCRLLIDGDETFRQISEAIDSAAQYIFIQFYIVRDDELGTALQQQLIKKANEGVKVYFLFDAVGSFWLPEGYIDKLEIAGVRVVSFRPANSILGRFSINFRNHRKLVIVDGERALVGGHNVGDEYVGKDPKFGKWRDTHIELTGPAVGVIQASFIEDWYFVRREVPELSLKQSFTSTGQIKALPIYTGPTSAIEDCSLMFMEAIAAAKKRFWIASPYFVPDEPLLQALQRAALSGKDVRVLLPMNPDHYVVWLASLSYFQSLLDAGVKVYRYRDGFLHQKVFLVDDYWSSIGTANLDNRSLRLNFELSIMIFDHEFAYSVHEMLVDDFESADRLNQDDIDSLSTPLMTAASIARLFSPLL